MSKVSRVSRMSQKSNEAVGKLAMLNVEMKLLEGIETSAKGERLALMTVEATKAELKAGNKNEDQSNVIYSDESVGKQRLLHKYLMYQGNLQPKALPIYPENEVTYVSPQRHVKFHKHSVLDVKSWHNELVMIDQIPQNEAGKSKHNADANTFILKLEPKYSFTNVYSTPLSNEQQFCQPSRSVIDLEECDSEVSKHHGSQSA